MKYMASKNRLLRLAVNVGIILHIRERVKAGQEELVEKRFKELGWTK
jgi:hypothetical protein